MLSAGFSRGITLIELMLSIAVGLILASAVVTLMLRLSENGANLTRTARLDYQLRTVAERMSRDLRRAGYVNWRAAWDACAQPGNYDGNRDDGNGDGDVDMLDYHECVLPVLDDFGAVRLYAFPEPGEASSGPATPCSAACDCVLFAYDLDEDGAFSADRFERFGFRWNGEAVEMRTAGSDHDCNSGIWQDMTDGNVAITALRLGLDHGAGQEGARYRLTGGRWDGAVAAACEPGDGQPDSDRCLHRGRVTIGLEGELAEEPLVHFELNTEVRLRNDYLESNDDE